MTGWKAHWPLTSLAYTCGFEFHKVKYHQLRALLLLLQSCGIYHKTATWETSQMTRCGIPNEKSLLEKTFSCCLFREARFTFVMNRSSSCWLFFLHREERMTQCCSCWAGKVLLPSGSAGHRDCMPHKSADWLIFTQLCGLAVLCDRFQFLEKEGLPWGHLLFTLY